MNKRTIVAVVCLFIVTIGVIIGASLLFSPKPNTKSTITDRDTGEVFNITVNNFQTGGDTIEGTSGLSVIFGTEKFMNAVYDHKFKSSDFATDVRNAIYKYSSVHFENSFTSITLRPQSLVFNDTLITGQLRLGQGDRFANFSVRIFNSGKSSITKITSAGQKEFYYIGGLNRADYTAHQDDYSTPEVTIDTPLYRENAIRSIKQLGFPITDLDINFRNYKNPFL